MRYRTPMSNIYDNFVLLNGQPASTVLDLSDPMSPTVDIPEDEQSKSINTAFEYGGVNFLLSIVLYRSQMREAPAAVVSVRPTCDFCHESMTLFCDERGCPDINAVPYSLSVATRNPNRDDWDEIVLSDENEKIVLLNPMGNSLSDGIAATGKNPYDAIIMESYLREFLLNATFNGLRDWLSADLDSLTGPYTDKVNL